MSRLGEAAHEIGYTLEDYLAEKLAEARGRQFLRTRPAGHLSEGQIDNFLAHALGREPKDDERKLARSQSRRLQISESERISIETRQNDRCGLCGRFLDRSSSPHLDHVLPLALGGRDELENIQLLCRSCNLGKGAVPVWQLSIPLLERRLTKRLRYCVLARARGNCQVENCASGSTNSELSPLLKMPAAMGGTFTFDNLIAACDTHSSDYLERRSTTSIASVRRQSGSAHSRVATLRRRAASGATGSSERIV
ncbi:HNH endonuclease [Rhodococcus koreensis]